MAERSRPSESCLLYMILREHRHHDAERVSRMPQTALASVIRDR